MRPKFRREAPNRGLIFGRRHALHRALKNKEPSSGEMALSVLVCGAATLGALCLAFLIYEIRNAPYEDCIDAEALLVEIDRQRLEL